MLIACKCLNITLKSTANLPVAASISSNYDDIAHKTKTPNANQHTISSSLSSSSPSVNLEDNYEVQPPYLSTAENLDCNQLQFFRTVNMLKIRD